MVNVFHILWDGNLGGIQKIVEFAFLSQNSTEVSHHAVLLKEFGVVIKDGPNRWALHARNGYDFVRMNKALQVFSQYPDPILHFHNDCRLFHHMCKDHYKIVITEHGEIFFHPAQRKIWDLLLGSQYLNARAVCGVSDYIKSLLLLQYPILADRTGVIHNPLLKEGSCTPKFAGPFSLGYIGRLSHEKGVLDLVPLCRKFPGTPFYIVGDGPLMAKLRSQLHDCTNVVFTGFVEDISVWLDKISLLVAPSYLEAFNMTIIEAMAYGVPTIAYKTGGIPEIINHGTNGWLVPAGAIEEMTNIIQHLQTNPKRLVSMAAGLQNTVTDKYSLSRYQASYNALYKSIPDHHESSAA